MDELDDEAEKMAEMELAMELIDVEYLTGLESTLLEWNSPEDDEAFRDL